jgi:chemotaxis protein methyltransferase CheR
MKPEDYGLVAQLCASRAGLEVDPRKSYFIDSRLGPIARRDGFNSVEEMINSIRQSQDERLTWSLVEAIATGEASFFRDRTPFEQFATDILPKLARSRSGEPIRVWSAACGAGQEVYSLAMTIDEIQGELPTGTQVELYGSDLSERALEKAQSGLYTQFEIQRGLPIQLLVRHFEKVDDNWRLSPKIRQMVRWRRINLIADMPASGRFDVIFCRYVLSTMTSVARATLLTNLSRALSPVGVLVLGQGEANAELDDLFRSVLSDGDIYVKDSAGEFAREAGYYAAT